jgi:hypothetical protein
MMCSFVAAARRGNNRILGSVASVLGALFIMLAAVHRVQAQNAPRAGWMLPGPSALNPSKLAESEADLRDLSHVDGGNIGNNSTGLIRSAGVSVDHRCEMSPEEFAKFYPLLFDWIQTTLAASAPIAESVAAHGFVRLPLYFTEKTLTSTKVVLADPLPMPPLSSMGLVRFADFERGNFDGITYIDTIFMKQTNPIMKTSTFMSLSTLFNGDCSVRIVFYLRMRMAWNVSAIGKVHWKLWHTMLNQRSLTLQLFSMRKRWSLRNLPCIK